MRPPRVDPVFALKLCALALALMGATLIALSIVEMVA